MKAIVAGGHGFLGRHLCAWLERAGHEVQVVGRGDPLGRADVVIHLGLFDEATAREAVDSVRGCPLVVASSGDVYFVYDQLRGREAWDGVQPGPLSEASALRAQLFPYGRVAETSKGTFVDYDKILVERVVLAEPHTTVLRLPKLYGPGDPSPIFGAAVRRMQRGEPVVISERLAGWRWTHGYVEDVAHAIGLAATRHAPGIYNIGEAEPPTALDRLRAIVGRVVAVPDAQVPSDLVVPIANAVDLVFDTSRIRRELGYREVVDPATAYARTIRSIEPGTE